MILCYHVFYWHLYRIQHDTTRYRNLYIDKFFISSPMIYIYISAWFFQKILQYCNIVIRYDLWSIEYTFILHITNLNSKSNFTWKWQPNMEDDRYSWKDSQSILTNIWKIDIQLKSENYHSSSWRILSHLSWIVRVRDRFVTRFVIATPSIHRFRIRSLVFPTKLETVLLVAFDGFLRLPS